MFFKQFLTVGRTDIKVGYNCKKRCNDVQIIARNNVLSNLEHEA